MKVISFDPCETSMRFPFVTNQAGYETGLAFTNASNYAGTCEIKFYGWTSNPEPMTTEEISSWGSMAYGLTQLAPMGFQGFLDVTCDFENGHGFAYIAHYGGAGAPGAAQGYLAVITRTSSR